MKIREHLTYANVAATLALAGVVGGGGAYAAGVIDSGDIKDNSIRSVDIKNRVGVKGVDVAERTLDAAQFAPMAGRTAGTCNPGADYQTCVGTSLRLRAKGRLMVIATGDYFSNGSPGGLACQITVDGMGDLTNAFPGELLDARTDAGHTDGFARTLVTKRLARGQHPVALRCKDEAGDFGRLSSATIAVLGILG